MNRLFVYGTLRLGSTTEQAGWLAKGTRHLGSARIRGRLFRASHYPALGSPLTDHDWVTGDVFEGATESLLQRLDEYEGAEYTRELVEATMETGAPLAVYFYKWALTTEGLEWIASGDWNLEFG